MPRHAPVPADATDPNESPARVIPFPASGTSFAMGCAPMPASAASLVERMRAAGAEAAEVERMDAALQGRLVDLIIEVGRASRPLAPYLPFPRAKLRSAHGYVDVCVIQDLIVSPPKIRIPALHIGIGLDVGAGDLLTFIGELTPPIPDATEDARRTAHQRVYRFKHYAEDAAAMAFGTRSTEAVLEQLVSAFEVAQARIHGGRVEGARGEDRLGRMLARLRRLGVPVGGQSRS